MRKLTDRRPEDSPAALASGRAVAHESARKHVAGAARYIDDLPVPVDLAYVAIGQSIQAHARIKRVDLSRVRAATGVLDVVVQADIPGKIDVAPVYGGDPLLAGDEVEYVGQPIFAVAATSQEAALRAVALAEVEYEPLVAHLTVEQSIAADSYVLPEHHLMMGDPDGELMRAPHRIEGEIYVRGQEHFYLEGQVGQASLTEDGGIHVISSTQHPSEIQKLVAEVLALPFHHVVAEVRRMGGGFGGKESQAGPLACLCALFAHRLRRPVRYRMPRRDDMVQTGKRHDFLNRWQVGFDDDGRIQSAKMVLAGKCGYSPDLSEGIVDRAMFHADNAYYLNSASILGLRCKTHTVSNTAFRGFGGPQGMMAIETIVEDIARALGMDPLDARKTNLYQPGRDETPYGQTIEQHMLVDLMERLEESSDYRVRREAITAFNRTPGCLKKGLALTPVKFGISFTAKHLNQAGALLQIYTDGTVLINHGGTEMGQGLYTKVQQIVANAFGLSVERVQVSSTRTDKVPNTSPTAASSGTDLNGMAARDACDRIKSDLLAFAESHYRVSPNTVRFENNRVYLDKDPVAFEDFIKAAYLNRVPLFSTGYYRTPKIHYDRTTAKGQPFLYFANGAAVSEVTLDTDTGEYKVNRVDILHDVGQSINPAIDIGQIEGGFIQGMGWLTTEELLWDDAGRVISNSPANYKIPTAFDTPEVFNVALYNRPNIEETVYHSKAVGEPPLMLAISVWAALRDACASLTDYRFSPRLDTPATPERVYWALRECEAFNRTGKPVEEVAE
ncbi:xanthine dehydrogenase molybdopterin binding subunit [Marinimicrobium sp.]|uniref:xanthine dehydrogenase molybdopterin binding subunit n=2 Tax=unclassified Marinimicrobium TaxID=2632100 RepID=UPI000C3E41F6|nr:xanthine dehydrogenase molybdopterin binding subunit [Marinimicrobium sp.]MAN52902.1 xanthine dehydrogenase molybdopterin binding subunit [Marinimicrobium sp.]